MPAGGHALSTIERAASSLVDPQSICPFVVVVAHLLGGVCENPQLG